MPTKREMAIALAEAREVLGGAKEVVTQAHERLQVANETSSLAIMLARTSIDYAGELKDRLKEREDWGEILDSHDLGRFAEEFPEWSITSGVYSNSEPAKTFSRHIPAEQLDPARRGVVGKLPRDTYLSLADPEYFDGELADIFGVSTGTGDCMGNDDYHIHITAGTFGPITVGDVLKVAAAEEHLRQNYLVTPEQPPAQAVAA